MLELPPLFLHLYGFLSTLIVKTHQLSDIIVPDNEIEISAIRSQGAGGQNVNKVSSAIHLRFDINASTLPEFYKQRLLALNDKRISKEGVIIITKVSGFKKS